MEVEERRNVRGGVGGGIGRPHLIRSVGETDLGVGPEHVARERRAGPGVRGDRRIVEAGRDQSEIRSAELVHHGLHGSPGVTPAIEAR